MAITYIGSTLSVARALPSNFNESVIGQYTQSGVFYDYVGKIVSIGELGDTAEDVSFDLLQGGRRTHVNGIRDVGDIPVTVEYDITDGGILVVEEEANGQDQLAWRVVDTDGATLYFAGTSANFSETERTSNTYKGAQFSIRTTSPILRAT